MRIKHPDTDTGRSGSAKPLEEPSPAPADALRRVPIVGVGASAGGLEAFSGLLEKLPRAPGFAVVLIQHLQPTHASELAEILGHRSLMPVTQAEHGMRIEPDHAYVIPPNVEMRMSGDEFVLSPRPSGATPSLTVDVFLTSLAEQRGNQAIGVILSGSASDGTKGLAAIKAAGGITLAQDPESAAHRGMPQSAISADVVDAVLPVDEIARELVRLATHPYVRTVKDQPTDETPGLSTDDASALDGIITRVRRSTGLDLSHYKRPTLLRRLQRRMAAKRVANMTEYTLLLDSDPEEVTALLGDVLVRVTSFFRDPQTFEALKTEAFPSIMAHKPDDAPVRIWVPACATGQEAYSIAIVLLEYLETSGSDSQIQIFASDLREADLAVARRGVYPAPIGSELSEERLARYFTEVPDGYQIKKAIRELCIFARHDVTKDPPFARLDLVSCRNLLIYLEAPLQHNLLSIFHYALVPGGFLMLGDSEGAGSAPGLFKRTQHKTILARLPGDARHGAIENFLHRTSRLQPNAPLDTLVEGQRETEWANSQRQLDAMLLDKYAPAAVLVDDRLQIKQVRGDAGDFLRFRPGDATLDLHSMISIGLESAVSSGMAESRSSGRPAHRDAVRSRSGGGHTAVEIVVIPIVSDDQPMSYAILFNEGATVSLADGETGAEPTEAKYLRQELEAATERLRILREGRDAAHESLQAANEEIQSSNEELQSMNEELDTAKEELQSTNEELTTLNDELHSRNTELAQRNADLDNVLVSASIAMLVLDADLTIRHFTDQAAHAFNLIPSDVGRRVTDIRWNMVIDDVGALVDSVVQSGHPVEQEVPDESGRWFRMAIRPYLTNDRATAGAIVTLVDIDAMRQAQTVLERVAHFNAGANRVNAALGPTDEGSPSVSGALDVIRDVLEIRAAQVFTFEGNHWNFRAQSPGRDTLEGPRQLTPAEMKRFGLRSHAESAPQEGVSAESAWMSLPLSVSQHSPVGVLRIEFDTMHSPLDEAARDFATHAARSLALYLEGEKHAEILDELVAERTAALVVALRELEAASNVKNLFLANMSHELRTPLNSIIGFSAILLDGMAGELNAEQRHQLGMILSSGKHLLTIVSDLLDLEKIMVGAMPLTVSKFRVADVIQTITDLERPMAELKGIDLRLLAVDPDIVMVSDEQKVRQLLLNLVNNAIKFTDKGHVTVSARATSDTCVVVVEDTGHGMTPEQLERAFEEFEQVEQRPDHPNEGTGLGLSIATRLATLLGGKLSAKSTPGVGSEFSVVLALRMPPAVS